MASGTQHHAARSRHQPIYIVVGTGCVDLRKVASTGVEAHKAHPLMRRPHGAVGERHSIPRLHVGPVAECGEPVDKLHSAIVSRNALMRRDREHTATHTQRVYGAGINRRITRVGGSKKHLPVRVRGISGGDDTVVERCQQGDSVAVEAAVYNPPVADAQMAFCGGDTLHALRRGGIDAVARESDAVHRHLAPTVAYAVSIAYLVAIDVYNHYAEPCADIGQPVAAHNAVHIFVAHDIAALDVRYVVHHTVLYDVYVGVVVGQDKRGRGHIVDHLGHPHVAQSPRLAKRRTFLSVVMVTQHAVAPGGIDFVAHHLDRIDDTQVEAVTPCADSHLARGARRRQGGSRQQQKQHATLHDSSFLFKNIT